MASPDYAHFDEWWGPYHYSRGWETMGDVISRLAEGEGSAILSKVKLPFAEAKSCRDGALAAQRPPMRASRAHALARRLAGACMFCPCGAMRMELSAGKLVVNDREVRRRCAHRPLCLVKWVLVAWRPPQVMLLHLAESKFAWSRGAVALPAWGPDHAFWAGCAGVYGLGRFNASCGSACSARAPIWTGGAADSDEARRATRLTRHRVTSKWAGHIKYASAADPQVRLRAGACDTVAD